MPISQRMSRRKTRWALAIGLVCVAVCFLLRPTYECDSYALHGCPDTHITKIVYWRLGERGIAFTLGKYNGASMPKHGYLVNKDFSGFDAMFQAVLTCHNGKVVLNYYEGSYEVVGTPNIDQRLVGTAEFNRLRKENRSLYLEGW